MNVKDKRFTKFEDWDSDLEDSSCLGKGRLIVNQVVSRLQRGLNEPIGKLKTAQKESKLSALRSKLVKGFKTKEEVLHPQEPFLQKLNVFFVLVCVFAVSFDPLFFYVPLLDHKENCLDLDEVMELVACVLRPALDGLYILHIICKFRTGFISRSSRVLGRGQLVKDQKAIAKRYMFYFFVDVLAILPLPQICTTELSNSSGKMRHVAGDTFADRAIAYYRRRPRPMALLNDLYDEYISISDRYYRCLAKYGVVCLNPA